MLHFHFPYQPEDLPVDDNQQDKAYQVVPHHYHTVRANQHAHMVHVVGSVLAKQAEEYLVLNKGAGNAFQGKILLSHTAFPSCFPYFTELCLSSKACKSLTLSLGFAIGKTFPK